MYNAGTYLSIVIIDKFCQDILRQLGIIKESMQLKIWEFSIVNEK